MYSIHTGVLYWTQWICSVLISEQQSQQKSRAPDVLDADLQAGAEPRKEAFYDIGAHEGLFGNNIAKLGIPVYAWEANPDCAASLQIASDFPVFAIGLGNTDAEMTFYRYSDSSFNSMYQRNKADLLTYRLAERDTISVQVRMLDSLCAEKELLSPMCIKIDAEGAELPILQGAGKTLQQGHPVVICEQSYENTRNAGYTREALRDYLSVLGYRLFGIERDRIDMLTTHCKDRSIWNIIAVHTSNSKLQKALETQTRL